MLNIELPYDVAIPLLGEMETDVHTKTRTWTLTAALPIMAK